jgi:hypothetical protein
MIVLSSATTGIPALKADATASLMRRLAFKLAEAGARTSGILELDAASKWLANRESLCMATLESRNQYSMVLYSPAP